MTDNNNNHRHKGFHAVIHGRVQGVAFRYYARNHARRLGITGWVKNRHDGSVEIRAEGSPNALQEFETWLHAGPPAARVTRVDIRRLNDREGFPNFTVEY